MSYGFEMYSKNMCALFSFVVIGIVQRKKSAFSVDSACAKSLRSLFYLYQSLCMNVSPFVLSHFNK